MSYPAQRWAKAQVLRIGRKPVAIAVLGVIADAYRPDGRVPLNRAAIALRVGVTVDTVVTALKTLTAAGVISYRVVRDASNVVLGTLYTLHGFKPEDWPEGREGERVMVEQAIAAGCKPQPWWPRVRQHLSPENGIDTLNGGDSLTEGDSQNCGETLTRNYGGSLPQNHEGSLPPNHRENLPPSIRCKTVYKDGIKDGNKDGMRGGLSADAPVDATATTPECENLQALDDLFPNPRQAETSTALAPEDHPLPPAKEKPKAKKTDEPGKTFRQTGIEALPEDWAKACEEIDPDVDPQRAFTDFVSYWRDGEGKCRKLKAWKTAWTKNVRSLRGNDWKRRPLLKDAVLNAYRGSVRFTAARRSTELLQSERDYTEDL